MNISLSVSVTQQKSETELQQFLIDYALANDFPFALWRLPESKVSHLLISSTHQTITRAESIEELKPGFVFAPFDKNKGSVYIPGEYIFNFEDGHLKEPQSLEEENATNWLEKLLMDLPVPRQTRRNEQPKILTTPDPINYIQLVNQCIDEIEKGTFEKIVPSRSQEIDLPGDFDVLTAYKKLTQAYQHAFISLVNLPESGMWLGASPEILVSVENKSIFKTVALAGTQPYHEGMNLKTVAWTQKEIEEQALVERYIISCFKQIRVREYEEHGPKTSVAGNLIHLRSDFKVDLKAINFPQLGSVMLQLLHPTSAVCGSPLDSALSFLKKNEGYDRSFYSGYLGPINVNNNIDIFVNLRCMRIANNKAVLYAGAGVTIDSIAEAELEETEIKFNTLLNTIF